MNIGTINAPYPNQYNFDFERLLQAGFHYVDYQGLALLDCSLYSLPNEAFLEYFRNLKKEFDKHQIKVHQMHSLFGSSDFFLDRMPQVISTTTDYYVKDIIAASILNCPYVVIHHRIPFPISDKRTLEKYGPDIDMQFIQTLLPYAHKHNVTLCLENFPFDIKYTDFKGTLNIINEINDSHLGMCLDVGHFNCFNSGYTIYEAVKLMGEKLKVLHIHDNDGTSDTHLFPGRGNFDFVNLIKALKDFNFQGVFSLETISNAPTREAKLKEDKSLKLLAEKLLNQ